MILQNLFVKHLSDCTLGILIIVTTKDKKRSLLLLSKFDYSEDNGRKQVFELLKLDRKTHTQAQAS